MVSRVSFRSVLVVGVVLCFAIATVTAAGPSVWDRLQSLKSQDDTIAKLIRLVENTPMEDVFRTDQITVFLPPIPDDVETFRPHLPYHVIREKVHSGNKRLTTPQVFATYLSENGPYYLLDGTGKHGQALTLFRAHDKTMVEGGGTIQTAITGSITADNGFVHRIDRMLHMPQSLSHEMQVGQKRPQGTKFKALLDSLGWTHPWDAAAPVTAFIPTDKAMAEAHHAIQSLSDEEKKALVSTHLVHGAVAYANGLDSRTLTNHVRDKMTFAGNKGGYTYTSQENATLTTKVVKSDVFTRNGVIHFVDKVLFSDKALTSGRGQRPPAPKSVDAGRGGGGEGSPSSNNNNNAGNKEEDSSSDGDDSEDGQEDDQPGGGEDGGSSEGGDGTKPSTPTPTTTTTDPGRSSKPDPKPVKPSSAHRSYPSLLIGSLLVCVMSALLL